MKLFLILILGLLLACDPQEEAGENMVFDVESTQHWELVKMTGSFDGSETLGKDMEWQETYTFKPDLSFIKTRISDTTITSAGRFRTEEEDNEMLVHLAYPESSIIAGSCFGQETEVLTLRNKGQSLESTWLACDGPGLFYERTN